MEAEQIKYMIFKAKEIKDTLRLTGNIYKARTEETAYSRGFVRSEKYINELIQELESLSEVAPKEEKEERGTVAKRILMDELQEQTHHERTEDVIFWALEAYAKRGKGTNGEMIAYAIKKRIEDAEEYNHYRSVDNL